MNEVIIVGTITKPKFAHEINGDRIYEATLTTTRTSGTKDTIQVLMPEYLCNCVENRVIIEGEFRSHNTTERNLKLYVYANNIYPAHTQQDSDDITLEGYICKTPVTRSTPGGRIITDILLATPRNNMYDRSDYIPIVVWGEKYKDKYYIGDKVLIKGRIQSRIYKENKIAYEVSTKDLTKQN